MYIGYENGCKLSLALLLSGKNDWNIGVKLQIAKENPAMLPLLLASLCRYWHVVHVMVTSLPYSDVNK